MKTQQQPIALFVTGKMNKTTQPHTLDTKTGRKVVSTAHVSALTQPAVLTRTDSLHQRVVLHVLILCLHDAAPASLSLSLSLYPSTTPDSFIIYQTAALLSRRVVITHIQYSCDDDSATALGQR